MKTPRGWARATLEPLRRENATVGPIPWRAYLALLIDRPALGRTLIRRELNAAMPMPGQRWEAFQEDRVYEVLEAKPGRPVACIARPNSHPRAGEIVDVDRDRLRHWIPL